MVEFRELLQLGIFSFGLFVDGNVGVGVFPEGEEVFVGGERTDAGGIGICARRVLCLQGVRASYAETG